MVGKRSTVGKRAKKMPDITVETTDRSYVAFLVKKFLLWESRPSMVVSITFLKLS